MIVTGSYAARLRGVYPAWRTAPPRDIDVIGTRAEIKALFDKFGALVFERVPNRAMLISEDGVHIDADLRGHLLHPDLPADAMSFKLNHKDVSAMVARPELILALRRNIFPHSREGALRDIADYEAQGLVVSKELLALVAPLFGNGAPAGEYLAVTNY